MKLYKRYIYSALTHAFTRSTILSTTHPLPFASTRASIRQTTRPTTRALTRAYQLVQQLVH